MKISHFSVGTQNLIKSISGLMVGIPFLEYLLKLTTNAIILGIVQCLFYTIYYTVIDKTLFRKTTKDKPN